MSSVVWFGLHAFLFTAKRPKVHQDQGLGRRVSQAWSLEIHLIKGFTLPFNFSMGSFNTAFPHNSEPVVCSLADFLLCWLPLS